MGVDEQRRVGKNKENGIDNFYSVTQRQRWEEKREGERQIEKQTVTEVGSARIVDIIVYDHQNNNEQLKMVVPADKAYCLLPLLHHHNLRASCLDY